MATIKEAASMTLTRDDLEVMSACLLSFQVRMLRTQVITTWKDRECYNKVKALRERVEKTLDSFVELEALKEEKED